MGRPKLRDGDLMTFADAGKVLGVSREAVRKLVNAKRILAVRTAGGWQLVWATDVAALAAARAEAMAAKGHVRGVSL